MIFEKKNRFFSILQIKKLFITINGINIVNNFNLNILQNEIHILMGPNGSGKSTVAKVLAGSSLYTVETEEIKFCKQNLLEMSSVTRANEGLFLAFQYPLEIWGITNYEFLKIAYNEKCKYWNKEEKPSFEFIMHIEKILKKLDMQKEFLTRNLNQGFSGGEKKKNEILQMLILKPKLIILDEIDSGLDLDTLKIISKILNCYIGKKTALLIITHNPKILDYIYPNYLHIMVNGQIIKTGKKTLITELKNKGYYSF